MATELEEVLIKVEEKQEIKDIKSEFDPIVTANNEINTKVKI